MDQNKLKQNNDKEQKNIKITESQININKENSNENKINNSNIKKEDPITFSQLWRNVNYII
jgi:hypothetical protein